MSGFTHVLLNANVKEDWRDNWDKFEAKLKEYGMEVSFWGAAMGMDKDIVILLKGSSSDYAKVIGTPEVVLRLVLTDWKSHIVYTM